MNKIFNLCKEKDFLINNNLKIEYVKIAEFKKISITLGITLEYLIVLDEQKNVFFIGQDSQNFLPLFKIFELDFEEFKSSFIFKDVEISKLFPINKITIAVFDSESSYWVEKWLYFLENIGFKNDELLSFLKEHKNDKWLGQKNKQKIFKFLIN